MPQALSVYNHFKNKKAPKGFTGGTMGIQFKNVSHTYKGIQSKYDAIMDVNLNIDGKADLLPLLDTPVVVNQHLFNI